MNASVFCRANLNYVNGTEVQPIAVDIRNARECPPGDGWEVHGFELLPHVSSVSDFDDETLLTEVHHQEMAAFAKALTGCDHALVSGHIRRNPEQQAAHADLGPIQFVHSDFAPSYGDLIRERYRSNSPETEASLRNAGIDAATVASASRLLILQFWRNVGPEKMDLPIAFCDCQSTEASDILPMPVSNYAGGGFDFDTLAICSPDPVSRHHWYTYPGMTRDEVVAFRTYDSERMDKGEAFWTPHSAFADPEVVPGAPARRSIELRATCLFL